MAELSPDERELLGNRIGVLAEELAGSMGMEIVLAEVRRGAGRTAVRVFLDQPGGITLEDCERFSKRFSVLMDVEDWIPEHYVLEVSSPGLDRPLAKMADFQRFSGKKAKLRTKIPVDGQRNFTGRLLGIADGRVKLEVASGKRIEVDYAEIEKANLLIEL